MVYVDPLTKCRPSRAYPHSSRCLLFADSEAELHTFAQARLRLTSRYFERRGGFPRYPLNDRMREWAVRQGAKSLDRPTAVEKMAQLGFDGPRKVGRPA